MQYTANNVNIEAPINLDLRLEIMVKALKQEPIEIIENSDGEKTLEIYSLLKSGLVKSKKAPFNCRPYRDYLGRLHETKYLILTEEGRATLKNMLYDLKDRYKKSA
jgi:hypothetical protein